MSEQSWILEVENLRFAPPGREPVFENLGFRVPPGAFVIVRGRSGAGKSTLLRLLARLDEPHSGRLRFNGRDYADWEPPALRSRVCYLQQSPTVLDASVAVNLRLPFGFRQLARRPAPGDGRLRAALDELLLPGVRLEDNAALLSVGQKQRLCLARALLLEPDVLLLDEPTSALDPESRQVVEARTDAANLEDGVTVLLVSHNENELHDAARPQHLELGPPPIIPEALQ